MSAESQSEQIWQYAMRTDPAVGDARNAPLNVANDASGRDGDSSRTATDLSEELGSMPSRLNFHGLAQSQSQGVWLASEKPIASGGSESQKENMHLPIPSGSPSPLLPPPASNPISHSADRKTIIGGVQSSHVTKHVTSASLARADGMPPHLDSKNSSAPFSSGSEALIKDTDAAIRATTPLRVNNNKTVSFRSPTAPPSPTPPTAPRIKTMPPRLNRYAPRDINPSSQDSFAGPPVPQDLNTFARSSRILNNTFIRTSDTGGVEVIHRKPSQGTSTSLSEPAGGDEVMSISQSEHIEEEPTPSQVIRAAFDPSLSPPRPEPVVLVKDSQSDHPSQDSNRSNNSIELSSSSISFHLPSPDIEMVATQPNSQSRSPELNVEPTQPSTQPTQVVAPPDATLPLSSDMGPSPLPVPVHRRRQVAAILAARQRAMKDEVVPETPQSTVAPPSVRASVVSAAPRESYTKITSHEVEDDHVEAQYEGIPGPRYKRIAGNDERGDTSAPTTRLPSDGQALAQQRAAETEALSTRITRPTGAQKDASRQPRAEPSKRMRTEYGVPDDEVVPDSQEEEQQEKKDRARPPASRPPDESEVIPDSQEEERQTVVPSSPAVPLKELFPQPSARVDSPTPTPAAVKSPLRKGKLPEGVTHTRGRPSDLKGKGEGKAKAIESASEDESADKDHDADAAQETANAMDVDKGRDPVETAQPARVHKGKHAPARTLKKEKKTSAPTSLRKSSRKLTPKATKATTPVPGPSTRTKKRKSDPTTEVEHDDREPSAQPTKRQRRTEPPASTPVAPAMTSTRVFARRTDKGNNYYPGTVHIKPTTTMQTRMFSVKFDDGFQTEVDVQFMRQYDLEDGDQVYVKWPAKHRDCNAEVLSAERWQSHGLIEVQELGRGPDGDDFEVHSKFISIPEGCIRQQFSERRISSCLFNEDVDYDVPFDIPLQNERLAGMSFVITMPDLPKRKRSVHKLIVVSGGVVFEEWNSLLTLGSNVESSGRRMSGTADQVRMKKKDITGIIFCLADEARTTPKYLIALALGIPCISYEWVLEKALKGDDEQQVDWPAYILPAGYNATTRLPASQAFDRAWWRKAKINAQNLISDPPTFKPFLGKTFLCFGTKEFLFAENELGIFPKVLLAMGASYVEAVTDVTYVKRPPTEFDYTVVDDGEPLLEYQTARAVDVWWVKRCLVTGIEGPVPWPDPSNAVS